jgi:hypothetical protein
VAIVSVLANLLQFWGSISCLHTAWLWISLPVASGNDALWL